MRTPDYRSFEYVGTMAEGRMLLGNNLSICLRWVEGRKKETQRGFSYALAHQ